jgi:Glycosyltransferase family 9 (heptosyltransferase)
VLLAIPALRVLRRASASDSLVLAAQPRIGRLLEILGIPHRSVDFEALGLDALFEVEPVERRRAWPARCADELRRATRVVAWIGSREPGFVDRLTTLVPGSIVAPSVVPGRPVWEHLLHTVGATEGERALRVPVDVPAALGEEARRELMRCGWNGSDRLLLVHPGAGGRGKRWPAPGFAAVLERVATLPRLAVAVHEGPADSDAIAALPEPLLARAIGLREPPLPLLAGVLTHATAYLGNDSGISHLAAAIGVPSIVLFGHERLIWRPWAEHVEPVVVSPGAEESDAARVTAELTRLLR